MKKYLVCLLGLVILFFSSLGFAKEIPSIPDFVKDDRVLILVPHPDDETLGTGGAIQRALKSAATVRVVCYTSGDHNQLAFIVYEKRLTFRTGEFLHMGEVRRKETIAAMASLGLTNKDIVFLGYPDFGTIAILTKYWGGTLPFRSILTRISKVSYPEALSPNAPYVGESILKDMKTVIGDFKPTKIFVSHPADTNVDHQSLYVFMQLALWDLAGKIKQPQIFPYIIHVVGWPKPRGHHLDLELEPPSKFVDVLWQKLPLTEEETKTKQRLVSFYESQIEYNPPYLYTYVRKNELFGDYPEIILKEQKTEEISWQDVMLSTDNQEMRNEREYNQKNVFSGLAYARKDNSLFIRLNLRRKLDKNLGISIFLLGYSKKMDFAKMPKINVTVGLLGKRIKDKKEVIFVKDASLTSEGKSLILKLPFSCLGNPDCILSKVRTHASKFPLDASAWRIIKLR
jgi:LmbE family N-acetylglucosaminyl deacetylase